MKYTLYILFVVLTFQVKSQTFTVSPNTAIVDYTNVYIDLTVTGVGVIDCAYGLDIVCLDITHTFDDDLELYLIDPQGSVFELSLDNGDANNDYTNTCFDMSSASSITSGTPPYNGTFSPQGTLNFNNANNGQNANGVWQLQIYDDGNGDIGTLNDFSLTFAANPECDATPPTFPVVEDCNGGTTVCSDASFSGNSSGLGNRNDLTPENRGCLNDNENESSWYYFQAMNTGTVELTIRTTVDYDFAIWGPYPGSLQCPPTGSPLRCSFAGGGGDTGLAIGSGDNSENSSGDKFVNEIVVNAGDKYILLIDNFAVDGSTFTLDWTLSNGASLNCVSLPVAFSDYIVEKLNQSNKLSWKTYSESNNSHFEIQKRDKDGFYYTIHTVFGQGNSSSIVKYEYEDYRPESIINYYRIVQYDFDGNETIYGEKSVNNLRISKEVYKIYNILGKEVNNDYVGIVIYFYKDGTAKKYFQNKK